MKALLSLIIALVFSSASFSATHVVQVSSNQFSPSSLNVAVGDIVQFQYVSGFHTSTCDPNALPGTSFPAGASGWDQTMGSSSDNFSVAIDAAGTYVYGCQPHWPSMQGTITASGTLPIKLSDFKVTKVNNQPFVTWKTATEENSDYFAVRRSTDGSTFKEIARIPAAGTSTTERSYSYTDNLPNKKEKYIYYNLATYDKDGKVQISSTKVFKNEAAVPKLIYSLSPNPISKPGHLMLKFNEVLNAQGKMVLQSEMDAFPGLNNGHLHLGHIAAGTYTVVFKLGSVRESYKIVVK
jgi:plastocyanin